MLRLCVAVDTFFSHVVCGKSLDSSIAQRSLWNRVTGMFFSASGPTEQFISLLTAILTVSPLY